MMRAVLGICLLVGAATGCGGPENATVERKGDDVVFRWDGPGARLCVMEPTGWCPTDKDDKVTGGKAFWVIDATCYNGGDGFPAPVQYRQVPSCAKDVTAEHGGMTGGEPLVVGSKYKLMVTGFGSDPAIQEFTY